MCFHGTGTRSASCFSAFLLEQVDVNVHPAKIEVRFSNQQEIFEGIVNLIQNRLSTSRAAVPRVMMTGSAPVAGPEMVAGLSLVAEPEPGCRA